MRLGARGRIAAAVVAAGAVGIGAAVTASGESEPGTSAKLAWEGTPRVMRVPQLPDDRILVGRVRNPSLRPIELDSDDVRIAAADGRPLESTARFAAAFGHGLYSPRDAPREVAAAEEERLGKVVKVRPGASAPVTLSWRLRRGDAPPREVRFGTTTLRIPADP